MRLSLKFSLVWIAAAAVLGTSMGLVILSAHRIEVAQQSSFARSIPVIDALDDLRHLTLELVSVTERHVIDVAVGMASDTDAIVTAADTLHSSFNQFSKTVDTNAPELGDARDKLRSKTAALKIIARQIQTDMTFGAGASYQSASLAKLKQLEAELVDLVGALALQERQRLSNGLLVTERALQLGRRAAIVSSVFLLSAIVAFWFITQRSVVAPLQSLTKLAADVGRGEFVLPPDNSRTDEVGILTRAFRKMVREIEALVAESEAGRVAVTESEARFRDFAEASSDWLWETDSEGRAIHFSDRFADLSGLDPQRLIGSSFGEMFQTNTEDPRRIELASPRPLRNLGCRYIDDMGTERHCRISGRAVTLGDGTFLGYRGTATDTTSEVAALRKAEHLSLHDTLTGLPNRVLVEKRLDRHLADHPSDEVAIVTLDLDRFKEVNDTFGHNVGDGILVKIGKRLRMIAEPGDIVGRQGGDCFVLVQVGLPQPDSSELLCEAILAELRDPIAVADTSIVLGASVGVALLSTATQTAETLLRDSEVAMYRAKQDGRGVYRFYDDSMNLEIKQKLELEAELRAAIASHQLELHYQPLLETDTLRMKGVEALLRWPRPGKPNVSPADFIPLAEETGLIVPLGAWVLRTACEAARNWPDLFVAVNLSPIQFLDRGLLPQVAGALRESGLDPARLELEITENVLMEQTDAAVFQLDALRELGVRIVMDDFGTGYSSLSYLQRFRFDKIKLDRSFVSGIEHDSQSAAIVRTVLQLGQSLGIETLAEGVETDSQVALLASEGCNQLQGFLFSPAVPACKIDERLLEEARGALSGAGSAGDKVSS